MNLVGDHAVHDTAYHPTDAHTSRGRVEFWINQNKRRRKQARSNLLRLLRADPPQERLLPSSSLTEHLLRHPVFRDHSELERKILPMLKSVQRPHLARRILADVASTWPPIPAPSGPRLPYKVFRAAAQHLNDHMPEEFAAYTGFTLADSTQLDLLHTTPVWSQVDATPFSFFSLVDLRGVWVDDDVLPAIRRLLGFSLRALMLNNGGVTEAGISQLLRRDSDDDQHFARLQILTLTNCQCIGDLIAPAVAALPSLAVLDLRGSCCAENFTSHLNRQTLGPQFKPATSLKERSFFSQRLGLRQTIKLLDESQLTKPPVTPHLLIRDISQHIELAHASMVRQENSRSSMYTPNLGWLSATVPLDRDSVLEAALQDGEKGAAFQGPRGGAVAGGRVARRKPGQTIPLKEVEEQLEAFFDDPPPVEPLTVPLDLHPPIHSPMMLFRNLPTPDAFQPADIQKKPLAAAVPFINRKKEIHEWKAKKEAKPQLKKSTSEAELLGLGGASKKRKVEGATTSATTPQPFGKRRAGLSAFSGQFAFNPT